VFTVSVSKTFEASHRITSPDGEMEPLHTHQWNLILKVAGENLDKSGMLMDFNKLKKMLDSVIFELENNTINDITYFQKNSPSAENIAKYIFERLKNRISEPAVIKSVEIEEQPNCWAQFTDQL